MALNIKDQETERLAAEVAAMTGESKTGAVRQSLRERKERLILTRGARSRSERLRTALAEWWATLPADVRGRTVTKEEREQILGYGPDGV